MQRQTETAAEVCATKPQAPTIAITFVEHDGTPHKVKAAIGMTLMEAACWNGVKAIYAYCVGDGGCGTCQVLLGSEWDGIVESMTSKEKSTLRYAYRPVRDSRLACFIRLTPEMDGLSVGMPEKQF